jgi:hypothetical protein
MQRSIRFVGDTDSLKGQALAALLLCYDDRVGRAPAVPDRSLGHSYRLPSKTRIPDLCIEHCIIES